jgi:polyisoprenoid-binding protein YceI
MKTRSRWTLFGAALAVLTFAAAAHAAFQKVGDSEITFQAKGPAGLTIPGSCGGFAASESGGKLTMTVDLTKIDTDNSLRNTHTKKALGATSKGEAKLVVSRSAITLPADKAKKEGTASGKLTIAGKTKTVPFTYQVTRTGSDYHVQGLMTIQYTDFIKEQCYLGVCVDPEVKIRAKFKLRDN